MEKKLFPVFASSFGYCIAIFSDTCLAFWQRKIKTVLLIGLMLTIGLTMRPAAAPDALPENLIILKQMFAPGGSGTINGFNQLPGNIQNEILAKLLNTNNNNVQKAFFHAVENDLFWAIQPLIDQGASITYHDRCYSSDKTALMVAAERGNTAMVEVLTSAQRITYFENLLWGQQWHINFYTNNYSEDTALSLASKNGHTEILKLLLNRKANVNFKPQFYRNTNSSVRYPDSYSELRKQHTALAFAARNGHVEAVQVLIKAKAALEWIVNDHHLSNCRGMTAIAMAAYNGHTQVVKALIDAKAKLDFWEDEPALMCAARPNHTATVTTLIDAKANLNARNRYGQTSLIVAANHGHTETLKALIDGKANLDFWDNGKMTALMYAAQAGFTPTILALIDAKAQIDTSKIFQTNLLGGLFDRTNSPTALALAAQRGHIATAQTIADEYRNEVARSSCQGAQNLVNVMQRIHDNFEASTQRTNAATNDNDDNKSNFEQLPNTFLQSVTDNLPLSVLKNLRKASKTCRVISQVQFETQLINLLKAKFQQEQEDRCRAFVEQETQRANLPNPLAIVPFDYWQVALAAAQEAIAGRAAQPGCAIA